MKTLPYDQAVFYVLLLSADADGDVVKEAHFVTVVISESVFSTFSIIIILQNDSVSLYLLFHFLFGQTVGCRVSG